MFGDPGTEESADIMLRIALTDESDAVRHDRRKLLRLVRAILRPRMPKAIVDVAIVGARRIAALNREFLHRRGLTDVISFNLGPIADHGMQASRGTRGVLGPFTSLGRPITTPRPASACGGWRRGRW